MKSLFFLFLLCQSTLALAWSPNDLSVLLPFPSEAEIPLLLKPADGDWLGPLIPPEAYQALPQLVFEADNQKVYQDSLRVVAIRLDPCFREGSPSQPCRRQIRLVWQPLMKNLGKLTARDAAVHTFYDFDAKTWQRLLASWRTLSSGSPGDPMQVHPVIQRESLKGPYWQNLKSLLLRFCGQKNLVRISAMTLRGSEQVWTFLGFDVQGAKLQPITIPRVDSQDQLAALDISTLDDFFGGLNPEPLRVDPEFFRLIQNSASAAKQLKEDEIKAAISTAFQYENPRLHNPGTLDCVSCHMAQSVRRWGQKNYPDWDWTQGFSNRYPGPSEDSDNEPFQANLFRAFGYFNKQPVISQRVVNETAEVMKRLKSDSL